MYNLFTDNLHLSLALFVQIFGILCIFFFIGMIVCCEMKTQYVYWIRIRKEDVWIGARICMCLWVCVSVHFITHWSWKCNYTASMRAESVWKIATIAICAFSSMSLLANNKTQTHIQIQIQLTTMCIVRMYTIQLQRIENCFNQIFNQEQKQ